MARSKDVHPQTHAVHTGVYKDDQYNSVTTPIYTSSTYYFNSVDEPPPYDYTRTGNPTRQALNESIAQLEGGHAAFTTNTGMSAILTALMLLKEGDHIICGHELYGGTFRLFTQVLSKFKLEFSLIDMTRSENISAAVRPDTRLIYFETPTNPLLNIVNIEAVVGIAKKHNLLTILDNTFMTPLLQSPINFGVDLVLHSTTKYMNGHSDMLGGAIVTREKEMSEKVFFLVNALGTGASPFDAWLALRGIKTLGPRMECHLRNAAAITEFLLGSKHIKKVFYPGLKSHPQHELAKKQQKGFGGILSFELDLDKVDIALFFKHLNYFHLCVSLGGVESLIEQPWSMSHAAMDETARIAAGLSPGIIRISTGIEDSGDLIADLEAALNAAKI